MALFKITSRFTGAVLFELECGSLRLCVEAAVKARANLTGANLTGANLTGAYLTDANLTGAYLMGAYLTDANLTGAYITGTNLTDANLTGAYLTDANLMDANLTGAYLTGAYLAGANLTGAYLTDANLTGAYLTDANLTDANLMGAYLTDANLTGAHLARANLMGAYLMGAYLTGAQGSELAIAMTRILPDGEIIGWKKAGNVLVKLKIPAEAKRSHASGRKCRAEFAIDMGHWLGDEALPPEHEAITSAYGPETRYRFGETIKPDSWDDNWMNECSNGIHFFISRLEAEQW